MSIQATAILTTSLDSTAVLQELKKMKDEFVAFSKPLIVPQMDIKPALAKAAELGKQIAAKIGAAAVTLVPRVDVSGIDMAPIEDAVKGAVSVFEGLEGTVKNIKRAMAQSKNIGAYSPARLEPLRKVMNKTTKSTASLRTNIKAAFSDIAAQAKKVGISTKDLDKMGKGIERLTAGAGVFRGAPKAGVKKKAIITGIKEYEFALATAYANLQTKIKAMTAKTEDVVVAMPKIKVKPVAAANVMDTKAVGAWLTEGWQDFAKRYEWSQGRKAIIAEAEAAFSREAVMRKILGAVFNFSAEAGASGYFVGKVLETTIGVIKTVLKGLPSLFAAPLKYAAKKTSGIFRKFFLGIGKTIKGVTALLTIPLQAVLSIFQVAVNKYTIAILAALYSGINKIVMKAFLKLGKVLYRAAKGVFGKITGLIKGLFSSAFSTAFGSSGALGGVSIGKLFGLGGMATTIKLAADLEQAMRNVSTITGQMGASLTAVTRQVIDISNAFGKSAIDTATALYDVASAGFRGSDAIIVLRNSLTAARAGITDAKTASTAIVRTLRAWDMAAYKSSSVADIMFNVVKRGVITFQELAGQIPRVTSIAAAAGASFAEVGAGLTYLTRMGVTANQAVLGLSQLLKSIVAPTAGAGKIAKELGLEWSEAAVKKKGLVKVIQDAMPIFLRNKQAFRMLVGDIQAFNAAIKFSMDPGALDADLAAMNERGAAAQAAAQQAIGFNEQVKKFWTNFVNILRNIGQALLPMVQPILEKVVEWTQKIASFTNMDFVKFVAKLKQMFGTIIIHVGKVVATVMVYLYGVWQKTKNFLAAVIVGFVRAIAPLIASAMVYISEKIIANFVKILNDLFWATVYIFKEIVVTIDLVLEVFLNKIWLGIKDAIVWIVKVVWEGLVIIYKVLDWIVRKTVYFLSWLTGFGTVSTVLEKVNKEAKKLDTSSKINEKVKAFGKAFEQGFNFIYDGKSVGDYQKSGVGKAISELGKGIAGAGKDLYSTSAKTLKMQAVGMKVLIASLAEQHKKELENGENEKASITKQFLNQEKGKLDQLTKQLKESDLDKLLVKRQRLYMSLAKAQRSQSKGWYDIIIEEIKNNEVAMMAVEKEMAQKRNKILKQSQSAQLQTMDAIKNKAKDLIKAGRDASQGLGKLNEALDNIFGKNVEKIAKKYGVGQKIADSRVLTKDVIRARAAGFGKEDIDTIIKRGLMSKSADMTTLLTAFYKTNTILDAAKIEKMGLSDEIIRLLDQATELGLSEKGRKDLFSHAITSEAFSKLDKDTKDDKQTKFINQAMRQFSTIAEERNLQQRFNKAQLRLGELTNKAVTRTQQFRQTVEELEKVVVEIEKKTAVSDEIRATAGSL